MENIFATGKVQFVSGLVILVATGFFLHKCHIFLTSISKVCLTIKKTKKIIKFSNKNIQNNDIRSGKKVFNLDQRMCKRN